MTMSAIYIWFYCLPIPAVIGRVFALTAGYLFLRHKLGRKHFWRLSTIVLCVMWLTVIFAVTLYSRTSGGHPVLELIPFHSYRAVIAGETKEILRSNLMNVLLFYPVGLLACELLPKGWSRRKKLALTVGVSAFISFGIESTQYIFALGQAEIDDLIHNTLGAWIGSWICTLETRKQK